jgi:hypothetical protein
MEAHSGFVNRRQIVAKASAVWSSRGSSGKAECRVARLYPDAIPASPDEGRCKSAKHRRRKGWRSFPLPAARAGRSYEHRPKIWDRLHG